MRATEGTRRASQGFGIAAGILVATLAVFGWTATHEFISLDDADYIYENPRVLEGLSARGIGWAFTTFENGNWHPLTWISHLLDVQLFGTKPGPHHLVSVFLHAVSGLVLFSALKKATGAPWRSGLVAALFAIHPLRVESVAWAAERKDVLCALFWMLSMRSWVEYARRPSRGPYLATLGFFVLGLLAKPMIVTLPFVLCLVSAWPLGRLSIRGNEDPAARSVSVRLVVEMIPFLLLAFASCVVTVLAQKEGGAVRALDVLGLPARAANAIVSYAAYLWKTLWPTHLAPFYPLEGMPPAIHVVAAVAVLASVSLVVFILEKSKPYLAVGWLWYLGTLVPVIGLVQVGDQSMADRYTYVPSVGIFLMIAWTVGDLAESFPRLRPAIASSVAVALVLLGAVAWTQVRHWRSSRDLFLHTVLVTQRNWLAHRSLAIALAKEGRVDEAAKHYAETLRLRPSDWKASNNLGMLLSESGRPGDAVPHFRQALASNPSAPGVRGNLASALARMGRTDEAEAVLAEAIRLNPHDPVAHHNLGNLLLRRGFASEAEPHYREALRIEPSNVRARNNLGVALAAQGRFAEAMEEYRTALSARPDFAEAHVNLGNALLALGRRDAAIAEYSQALRVDPDNAAARERLDELLTQAGAP